VSSIDWELVWNTELVVSRRLRLNGGRFWDETPKGPGRGGFPDGLTEAQVALVAPEGSATILEIGPGAGRLTLPLARQSAHVTAVEPSTGMRRRLVDAAAAQAITNLTIVDGAWDDPSTAAALAPHDVVVASYSLFMPEVGTQVARMQALARRRVVLFVPGEPRLPPPVQQLLYGARVGCQLPDHVLLQHVLLARGLEVHVQTLSFPVETIYAELADAVAAYRAFHAVPAHRLDALAAWVASLVTPLGDGRVAIRRTARTGVVTWTRP
jgi:SAM-dependent methyltransferase